MVSSSSKCGSSLLPYMSSITLVVTVLHLIIRPSSSFSLSYVRQAESVSSPSVLHRNTMRSRYRREPAISVSSSSLNALPPLYQEQPSNNHTEVQKYNSEEDLIAATATKRKLEHNSEGLNHKRKEVSSPSLSSPSSSSIRVKGGGGIDPSALEIVSFEDVDVSLRRARNRTQPAFVRMFRGSAQYIANHRNTLVIYHIPGDLLEWKGFKNLMDDIALTWLLGIKVILVTGCRSKLNRQILQSQQREKLKNKNNNTTETNTDNNDDISVEDTELHRFGVRVTDINTLRRIKEEAGHVRFEVERQLARSLRQHGGLNGNGCDGNVLSGNFYSAQPLGVIDGVDYMYTGFPRRVEVEKIRQCHASNDIVLMTTLGASPSGEVFNVNSESLAATVAGAMGASKVVYFTIHGTAFRNKSNNKLIQNLRYSDVKNLLKYNHVNIHAKGFATIDTDKNTKDEQQHTPAKAEILLTVGWAMTALKKGVRRAHIIAPTNGALLQELFTRDGSGTLISRDLYEGIRPANVNDISGIYDLIQPLVNAGTLVPRSRAVLEKDINTYYVYTRDNLVVACAQIKQFEGGFAEIGCLVVDKKYRSQGRGDAMLGYLERFSVQVGCSNVFVLSTQTMEWFIERGFKPATVDFLPPSRKANYNYERRSKIYMKQITSDRDLDAAELWWNR